MKRVPFCHKGVHRLGLNSVQKNVYTVIISYADSNGLAWPNWGTMLTDSGLSRPALRDALSALVSMQLIREHGRVSRAGGGKKTVVWEIAGIDNDGNVSQFDTQPQPDPEPKPKMPRAERAKLMHAQMAAMTSEEFHNQIDWEWVNADLGETQFLDDPAQFLDDPEPQPQPEPQPEPKPKTKTKAPKPKPEAEIPAELLGLEGFASAWADWLTYRKQANLRALTPIGLTRQFSAMVTAASGGVDVVACINKAITANWQGIHLDTQTKPQTQAQITQAKSTQAKSTQKALYEEVMVDYLDSIGALDDNGELLPPWETNPKKGKAKSAPKPALVLTNTDDTDLPF